MRAYLIVIILLVALFGSIAGYLYNKFSAFASMDFTPPPVMIGAGVAEEQLWQSYIDAVGTVKASRGIELSSETSGEVTAIEFDSGEIVVDGQLLLVINDDIEQASRRNEIASLELAEILYQRDSKLISQKSIPQSQYDRSKADLSRARAQLAETEARIRNKRIFAPFAGTLGIRQVNLGDYISPGTVIASLQDLSELEIDFTLPSQAIPSLRKGQSVEVRISDFSDQVYNATIFAIDAKIDAATRNVLVRAKLAAETKLLPGLFAQLRVKLEQPTQTTIVPETAISYSINGDIVYVIKDVEGGGLTTESVIVKVGQVRDGKIAILEGIRPGDRVVTAGQNKLYRGAMIAIDEAVSL